MLRVAIIETESVAKDVIFELALLLQEQEWTFQYFTKISEFAKADIEKNFQFLVFHENLEIPRVTQSFIIQHPQRIVMYMKSKLSNVQRDIIPFSRIFYVNRNQIHEELQRIAPMIKKLVKGEEEYLFSYNNVKVPLRIRDIRYIEKQGKYLIYHSKRGQFRERRSMKDIYVNFEKYDFVWIHASYLVNMQYVLKIKSDIIYLQGVQLPISRTKKAEVVNKIRSFVQ